MFATMDQQPYLQGYYPIAQIAMATRYGLTPTDVAVALAGVTTLSRP